MSAALFVQTRKEVRALLPWTIGVAIAFVALALLAGGTANLSAYHELSVFFIVAYPFGALAVSALSVGQEITHGTLAALLVQPVERFRILAIKLSLLAIALIGLALVASATFPEGYLPDVPDLRRLVIWGPVAAGIGLAPLLTVLSRRPLGGVVFAPTIPGLILALSERVYPLHKGPEAWTITWYGTLVVCAAGLATLFLKFRTLEVAGDERGRTTAATSAPAEISAYVPTTRRPWVWLLIKKELRLQQMTFAVSGLYVVGAVATMILAARDKLYMGPTFGAISMIHAYCIPLIAGALASAEERHMGTLAGQILQPRSMRVQWILKSIVTIGIALLLACGLPLLLMSVHRPADAFRVPPDAALGLSILCAAAMWVSSNSGNTLWALLASFPAIGVAGMIGSFAYGVIRSHIWNWIPYVWDETRYRLLRQAMQQDHSRAWLEPRIQAFGDLQHSLQIIRVSLIVGFGVLVLSMAARNHRTLDRSLRRMSWQVVTLLLFAAVAAAGYWTLYVRSDSWLSLY
jgi:hypothetical protein